MKGGNTVVRAVDDDGGLVGLLDQRFFARRDAWAQQDRRGGFRALRGKLTLRLIAQHLAGDVALHTYCLAPGVSGAGERCMWGAFDIDIHGELTPANRQAALDAARSLAGSLVELVGRGAVIGELTGGRGLHVWALADEPVNAQRLQRVMDAARHHAKVTDTDVLRVERYPKQVVLAGKVGSALRVPLGRHPDTGQVSRFYDPVTGEGLHQLDALQSASGLTADTLEQAGRGLLALPEQPQVVDAYRPAPRSGVSDGRPASPDAWLAYRWAVERLGLSHRTARRPARGHGTVRCVFVANHANEDRKGSGSAWIRSDGHTQLYGCNVCDGGFTDSTLALIRRVEPGLSFRQVLEVAHRIDPTACPDPNDQRPG